MLAFVRLSNFFQKMFKTLFIMSGMNRSKQFSLTDPLVGATRRFWATYNSCPPLDTVLRWFIHLQSP